MFDFTSEIILENDCVRLNPIQLTDYEHLLHFSIREPEIWTHSLIQADAPEKLKQYIQVAIENRAKQESYVFVVFDKRTNQYAGSTRFYDIQLSQATLQLGYTWYGKSFQGSGINKQCKFLMLDFAFDVLKMERVELRGDTENARSIQAMKSIGCEVDGILRSNMIRPDGSRRDSIVLSILRNEWFSHKKALLKAKIDAI